MRPYRLFFCLLLLLSITGKPVYGQIYGNEWIDYSKTYYKFKTSGEGIFRITPAQLQAAGMPPNVTGNEIQLFRDGEEVPVYVSTTGPFGANDYIEFFAAPANGRFDRYLYEDTTWQANPRISLFSDTAVYFLTHGPGANLRYSPSANTIPPAPPAPLSFCIATASSSFTSDFLYGDHITDQPTIHVSLFYKGEGYVKEQKPLWEQTTLNLSTPNATTGMPATLRTSLIRNAQPRNNATVKVYLNNQLLTDEVFPANEVKKFNIDLSPSLLNAANTITFIPVQASSYERYGACFVEIQYPRDYNLNNQNYFRFSLPPSSASQYIEFTQFNHGGIAPRMYDLTNKRWYEGDLALSGKTRFYLEPSFMQRELVLFSSSSDHIYFPLFSKSFRFIDYQASANQGNFILITHPAYEASANGQNYIKEYRDYRASAAGGSHKAIVAYVTDLYDQFAYGVEMHPLSIRNFLRYAYDRWQQRPENVLMAGKGLFYHKYRTYLQNAASYNYTAIVPTFGDPGADICFVNFLANRKMAMNIGRINAWSPEEIGIYLSRLRAFESSLKTPALPTYENSSWKKNILHAAGGKNITEQNGFVNTLNTSAAVIQDTAVGGVVTTVRKNTTVSIDQNADLALDSLIGKGISMITFHGHSSPNGFEFNLNNPDRYHNAPKLPHFIALGCDVAQIFSFASNKTISENYLINPDGGSISMIASNNPQYATFHARYLPIFYTSIARRRYGRTIGDHHRFAYDSIRTVSNTMSDYMHIESLILQGDPATLLFGPAKPDYHISSDRISSIPVNVTTNQDSFTLRIIAYNLGRALKDTVDLKIEHINPAGTQKTIKRLRIANLYFTDTLSVTVPLDKIADIGMNRYKVTIDPDGAFDEESELNNTGTLELFIYSDNLTPVYPPEFAIVHQPQVTLKASTLNPFRPEGKYVMEIDTTELFNSPARLQTSIVSRGGVIRWTPSVSMRDSTVYYWRAAFDSVVNGDRQWSYSSFVYLAQGSPGWNQSHHFQYLKNSFDTLIYDESRRFSYPNIPMELKATSAVYHEAQGWPWNDGMQFRVYLNGSEVQRLGCPPWGGTLQIIVFDGGNGSIWKNDTLGTSGAYGYCTYPFRSIYAFEFPVWNKTGRDKIIHFLDSIPSGDYVMIRNLINQMSYIPSYIDDWKADTLINGSGHSLYHTLQNMGFTEIDSFYNMRPLLFFRKKNDNSYPVYQYAGKDSLDRFEETFHFSALLQTGVMRSPLIGPAKTWDTLKWRISAWDNQLENDDPQISIFGLQNTLPVLLYQGKARDTSLSFISASQYPNIQIHWRSTDTVNRTSPHLDYWRVLYEPVPEAALNPAMHYRFLDSLEAGQLQSFSVAIENISDLPMDSMLVHFRLIDNNNTIHHLGNKRYKKLPAGDTLQAGYEFDSRSFPGRNVLFVEANPNKDQPEQYHPNNIGYIPFSVSSDNWNPFVDVTFDGIHILNKDIVSAKPFIRILLKDENKFLKLDDTALLSLKIRYPNDILQARTIPFDGTICKFIPASGEKNEAVIEYRPAFSEDGEYQLMVNGRDKSGNAAGNTDYEVAFEVINKSTITNILNYPNPFSTSTAFLFTLTGSELPTQFKIQIMTVTGKVVREITRQELGPIHIGRNITEYKWDGKDQYGQLLGNGVYLYRVVTAINGKSIEHRGSGADKFYKNGYGKLYIMR